jgi:hypothetical protein
LIVVVAGSHGDIALAELKANSYIGGVDSYYDRGGGGVVDGVEGWGFEEGCFEIILRLYLLWTKDEGFIFSS